MIRTTDGEIESLICTYDPESRGGSSPDGRKVKGTIHWVSARHAVKAAVNLYDRLFTTTHPGSVAEIEQALNPESLVAYQFERLGYFISDSESTSDKPVFNRTMTLRDSWARIEKSG